MRLAQCKKRFVDDFLKNETIILLNISKYYLILANWYTTKFLQRTLQGMYGDP